MNHKYKNRIKHNIGLDYINSFITNLNMQSSIWVLYLAFCGLKLTEVGLLEGIYHATSIICEIPSGAAADLLGRKKSMIVSRICVALSCVIMLFSKSFWWFALSFAIQALGNNFNSGSEEALVYDSMKCLNKEEKYMGVCGRLNMIIEISQALAAVAGGILAEYSYFWCYAACVVIAILALIPVLLMVEPPTTSDNDSERYIRTKQDKSTEKNVNTDKKRNGVLTTICNHFKISIVFLFAGGTSCLGAMLSDKLYHYFGKKIAAIASVLIAICFLGYGFDKPLISIGAFLISGFFNSVLYPVQSYELNSLIPSEQRATLISVNSMFFSIPMIITFPVVGAMADEWGLKRIISILGIALLLFLFIWIMVESRVKNKRNKTNEHLNKDIEAMQLLL